MNAPLNFSSEKPTERQARSAHVIKAIEAAEAGENLTPRRRKYEKEDVHQAEITPQSEIVVEDGGMSKAEIANLLIDRSGRKKVYYTERMAGSSGEISTADVHPEDILEIAFRVDGEK